MKGEKKLKSETLSGTVSGVSRKETNKQQSKRSWPRELLDVEKNATYLMSKVL